MKLHKHSSSLLTDTSIRHTPRVAADHSLDISLTTADTSLKQKPKVGPMPSLTHFSLLSLKVMLNGTIRNDDF